MGKFPNLTILVRNRLREVIGNRVLEREFYLSRDKQTSFKADVSIKLNEKELIIIEIEETQAHPDTNVAKYWPFLEENPDLKITLFHFFGRGFTETKRNYVSRKNLCSFLAEKMKKQAGSRFRYHQGMLPYKPQDYETGAAKIAEEISQKVLKYINP